MKLSIIVPVYNVEKYLNECIDSILNQTFTDFELVLVDDGSTDNSSNIIEEYKTKDNRVVTLHKKNGGLMSAWKYGFMHSKGEYIGFVDSDDWIDNTMYEKMITICEKDNSDIVCSRLVKDYANGGKSYETVYFSNGYYNKEKIEKEIFPYLISSSKFKGRGLSPNRVTKIVKRECVSKIVDDCDDRIAMGEDLTATFAFVNVANSISFINDETAPYHYRINNNSYTQNFSQNKYDKVNILHDTLLKINDKYKRYDFRTQINTDYVKLLIELLECEILASNSKKELIKSVKTRFNKAFLKEILANVDKTFFTTKHKFYLFMLKHRLIRLLVSIRKMKRVK